jgi:HlyD family secretion protein
MVTSQRSELGSVGKSKATSTPGRAMVRWLVLAAFGVFALAGGVAWWMKSGQKASSNAEHDGSAPAASSDPQVEPTYVNVIHPHTGGIRRVTNQPATVNAFDYAKLYAKISGYLAEQSVDIGDRVKKGQVLAVIDDPEVVEEADRAAAQLKLAKAQLLQAQARIRSAEAGRESAAAYVEQSKTDIEKYASELRYRESSYTRMASLYKQKAVDAKLVDEETERRDAAQAALHSAEAAVVASQAQLAEAAAKVEQAKADSEAAKQNVEVDDSNLAKAQVFVNYTKIVAPFDGVITHRNFHVGDLIQAGNQSEKIPLLRVARTDLMRVVVLVPDNDSPFTDPSDPAVLTISTLGNRQFSGKVARVSDSLEVDSRTMRTEIDLPNSTNVLREGMYGTVEISLSPATNNLTIPSNCLVGEVESNKASVYVVREGRAHRVPVKIGTDNGVEVEIVSGLHSNDEVVTTHGGTLAEGQPVVGQVVEGKES